MIRKYNPEKITSYQITKDYAHIDNQCLESMVLYKFKRNSAIIESICYAVGKTTYDEQRHCKKKRYIMLLTCKCHGSCHHESTWNTKKETPYRSSLESESEYILCRCLNIERRHTGNQAHDETSYNISTENDK